MALTMLVVRDSILSFNREGGKLTSLTQAVLRGRGKKKRTADRPWCLGEESIPHSEARPRRALCRLGRRSLPLSRRANLYPKRNGPICEWTPEGGKRGKESGLIGQALSSKEISVGRNPVRRWRGKREEGKDGRKALCITKG